MSNAASIDEEDLVEIASPYVEPRIAFQTLEARRLNNLTLIDGQTFLSTTTAGDIMPAGAPDVGFFHDDTRFLSHLELRLGGHRSVVLSASTEKSFASQIELTTGTIRLRESLDLPEHTLHMRREQLLVNEVFYDRVAFENFNLGRVELVAELHFDADFVDVFQVRGAPRSRHGTYFAPVVRESSVAFHYRGLDGIMRHTHIVLSPAPHKLEPTSVRWNIELDPLKRTQIAMTVTPSVQGRRSRCTIIDFGAGLATRRQPYADWESRSTRFSSSNKVFDVALGTSISDFHALRIPDGDERILAAGIPWFATMFGRDSIISAYQSLSLNPQLAIDTLRVLARYQGKVVNDWLDEEPGKIMHEYRAGEMTRHGEMPFCPYYGSLDSTPLFLILLSETYNWTGDEALVRELLPNAIAALDWIDNYGDLDDDGFVEYKQRSPKGLANQSWKDSWDAALHRDGRLAEAPIAPVEVQGYVYDAKMRMSSLLRALGDTSRADRLKREAYDLATRFEKAFWMPYRGFYAMALDGQKKPLEVISSNPGHLLFSRIVSRERARSVVKRMMKEDMFSGWGWRTLAQSEPVFNPLSYHRGSVWPHDNSIIAHGMALNEFRPQAIHAMTTLFEAALKFRDYRLPELFCGVQRREFDEPVHYPVSCSPQAWASGAMFLMLASVLGFRPNAAKRELNILNPLLPEWIDTLHIRKLRVGGSRVGLDFTRHGVRTFCNVVDVEGEKLAVNVGFRK